MRHTARVRPALAVLLLLAGCSDADEPTPRAADLCGVLDLPHETPAERLALIAETEQRLTTARGTSPRDRVVGAAAVVLISTRATEAIASLAPSQLEPQVAGAFDSALDRLRTACGP